ncbi:MAG: hypothetical protein DHS20C12_30220 [Pseudohongiella sp.]|nr:MAG: hypothetical protein DHS20C12_30220 [Pseudohongiella sp.]
MLWLGSWIVLFSFWFYVIRLALLDGLSLSLFFGCLWCIARFAFPQLGIEGAIYFVSFSALLTSAMIFIDLYRHSMGIRNPQQSPLDEIEAVDTND